MLKLNYTEAGLHMERVVAPLEVLIAQRVLLAVRFGQILHIEPGTASFLLRDKAPDLAHLEMALRRAQHSGVTITPVDDGFVEVSVEGSWIAESADAHEGMFITAFCDRAEFFVYKLWQATQFQVSSLA